MIEQYSAFILSGIGIINAAQLILMGATWKKVEKLSNGCFTRHEKLAEERGANRQTLNALHDRVDKMEEKVERFEESE